jgi:MFS family permease
VSWLIWGCGVLFYVYDFLIRVSPGVMVGELMRDFAVNAAGIGALAAWYLYSYGAMQVPVGVVLDRFGPRRLLTAAAATAALGCLVFAAAPAPGIARVGRFLSGLGGGASFLGSLAIAQTWLPAERYAIVAGGTMAIGIFTAMLAQPGLALIVQHLGWRPALAVLAAAGTIVVALLWRIVPEAPPRQHRRSGTAEVLRLTLGNRQVWLLAVVDAAMAGPMLCWGGLWSIPYLQQCHALPRQGAAAVTAVLLVGWGLGGPLGGWLSQRLDRRKGVLAAALAVAFLGWLILARMPALPLPALVLVYAAIGLASGGMLVGFALARALAPATTATAGGVMNTLMTCTGAALQPACGWVLDRRWEGAVAAGVRVYPPDAWGDAMLLFAGLQLAALLAASRLAEGATPRGADAAAGLR